MRKVLFFLGILSDSEIDWMIAAGIKRAVAPGRVLIQEGVHTDCLFLVLGGKLRAVARRLDNLEVSLLLPGDLIGETAFVDMRPPALTIETLEKSVVLAISRSILQARLDTDAGFAARFYRALAVFLCDRLRSTAGELDSGEIDIDQLDNVSLASTRFDWLQRRMRTI